MTSTVNVAYIILPFIPIPLSAVCTPLLVLNLYLLEKTLFFKTFFLYSVMWREKGQFFLPLPLLTKSSLSQSNSFSSDGVQTMRDLSCIKDSFSDINYIFLGKILLCISLYILCDGYCDERRTGLLCISHFSP